MTTTARRVTAPVLQAGSPAGISPPLRPDLFLKEEKTRVNVPRAWRAKGSLTQRFRFGNVPSSTLGRAAL